MDSNSRRRFLKLGGTALAAIPILCASGTALAAKNEAVRASMKYQDHPGPDGKDCSACLQFIAGKTPTALGGCKIYPGDTEISPHGYCIAWTKKA